MTKKLYDLTVKTGEYIDREGNTKANWLTIGALMEGNDGNMFAMIERTFNPAGVPFKEGSRSILVSCFEPREQDGRQGGANGAKGPARQAGGASGGKRPSIQDDLNDEIQF